MPNSVPLSVIMSSMKIIRNVIVVLALLSIALVTSACPEKGPAEKAGEKIDDAIDKTKDAIKEPTK
jgi:outer membrane lipoprotein-sorting protein